MRRTLEADAARFAAEAHKGQKRKYTGEPYIQHPAAVAAMVKRHIDLLDESAVAAAWLHECGGRYAGEIDARFGIRVAGRVRLLTDEPAVPGGPNRAERHRRKVLRYMTIQGQASVDVHTIKAADMLDNATSIKEHDRKYFDLVIRDEMVRLGNVLALAPTPLMLELGDVLDHRFRARQ